MDKIKFDDFKKSYDKFWDKKGKITRSDIKLMIDLINERSVKNGTKTKNI